MEQVQQYLTGGEGLTQYQFFKVETKIGALLAAWKQPETGDVSLFVERLILVLETGKQFENLKFRQTIAEKLAALTAAPEAPSKKSSFKLQKKKKSVGAAATPAPAAGDLEGDEVKPQVLINNFLVGPSLPRLLLLRKSLSILIAKAGSTAEEMASGLKG
mmetsp:Transcript_5047/g.7600  ORF Transcript_5047/g.7600 Transcript_5047/m.7600 type:complete len:160 (+) Transcript_5047:2338-2817(+)